MEEKRDIAYLPEQFPGFNRTRHRLDLYFPTADAKVEKKSPVVVFIHGGTWISGSKDMYSALGRNFAASGLFAAVINYRLGDEVNFQEMSRDCAAAVKWIYDNAEKYGGNKHRISVCGHSAGGHLGALISLSHEYFDALNLDNPIKSCILIDAFGMNIGGMIRDHGTSFMNHIEKVFTNDPQQWKKASPVNFITYRRIPFLIFVGDRSYPILIFDNERFRKALDKMNQPVYYTMVKGKTHMEMIRQMERKDNPLYKKIVDFIKDEPDNPSSIINY